MMNKLISMTLVLTLAACSGSNTPKPKPPAAPAGTKPAVARVGDRSITEADIDAEFAIMPAQFQALKANPAMRANVLNSMLDRDALLAKARRMGIMDEPEIRHRIEASEAAIVRQALDRRMQQQAAKPDAAAIKAYYEANKQHFHQPERVHVRQILVKSKAAAERLMARLKKGADFAKLAGRYSLDAGSKAKGGELPAFSQGMMEPSFSRAAFSLHKKGALAGPVKSPFGYHIIQLIGRTPAGQQSLEQARPQIEREMRLLAAQAWMKKARADAGVQVLKPAYRLGGK